MVIGILIAIQINNWYQKQSRKALEIKLLGQVKEEIISIKKDLENDLSILVKGQNSSENISNFLKSDKPYHDSLCFFFILCLKMITFIPKKPFMAKLKKRV